jgi:predicted metal-dependent hydrolase
MSTKQVEVEGLGVVTLYKRRGTRSVRLSIASGSKIRVTIPAWAPYKIGVDFAVSKRDWILAQRRDPEVLSEGRQVGKAHRLRFVRSTGSKISSRIKGTEIYVALPAAVDTSHPGAQTAASKAAVRALKAEAEHLLPQRLKTLADLHGFTYRSIAIKQMKGRWGSCNQHRDIVLNCYLMELPWQFIDYVLVHELVHTRVMAHGKTFWDEVSKYVPNLQHVRKLMKSYQPII